MLTKPIFQKYLNQYFVETGTFQGFGVQQALLARFPQIISIELGRDLAQEAQQLFKTNKNVKIIQGDAACILNDVIKEIKEPITFWLDGHFSGPYKGGMTAKGDVPDPILQELQIIAKHQIRTHTILIDDIRLYQEGAWPWQSAPPVKIADVEAILRSINPNYKFALEDGFVKQDILVAYP